VLKLTLGTWLETYDGSYDADVYVGVHENYSDYHPGMKEIRELEPHVRLTLVEEVDWFKPPNSIEQIMRYSEMHSKSLLTMMRRARKESGRFTHAAFLDHDLMFERDFVGWAMRNGGEMVGSLFEDREADRTVTKTEGGESVFAPKPSVWHLVVGRLMFQSMLEWPELIRPGEHGGRVFDTMAWGYEMAKRWGLKITTCKCEEIAKMVKHLWSLSFNYGPRQFGDEIYARKIMSCEREYDRRFPNGIGELLNKLGRS
jgi:hypothetical protein